jgi:hypothetical protein
MTISRRDLVVGTIALATTMLATRALHANPLGLPLGIQLYSVRTQMIEDFDAALAAVHAAGYSEVEAASAEHRWFQGDLRARLRMGDDGRHEPGGDSTRPPHRISMLHVKDFKMPETPAANGRRGGKVTELGLGSIGSQPIFEQAAKTQTIRHAFVEQEGFDMPWQDSLKVDAEYMRKLKG